MPYKTSEKVREANRKYVQKYARNKRLIDPEYFRRKSRRQVISPERRMFTLAKCRAKKAGLDFSIDISDIVIPERCPIFGITMERNVGVVNDNSPTLDRIDTSKGYVRGNVWVISWRANRIKNDATIEELERLATAVRSKLNETKH